MKRENKILMFALLFFAFAFSMAILTSCQKESVVQQSPIDWVDDIHNPENFEYVQQTADDLMITYEEVTQDQFNKRYYGTLKCNGYE